MKTLITLIIGIIIGAAGLFYGMKNGMVTMDMVSKGISDAMPQEEAAPAHKPHAQAPAAPKAAAAPEIRTEAPAQVDANDADENGFDD